MTMEIKRTLKIKDEDEARDFGLELGRCAKAGHCLLYTSYRSIKLMTQVPV